MGNLCSVGERVAGLRTGEADSQTKPRPIHITKMPPSWMTEKLARQKMNQFMGDKALASLESYEDARNLVLRKEQAMAFDAFAQQHATPLEKETARIVRAIRASDVEQVWTVQTDHQGDHRRPAGHFLGTVDIINQTELIKVAKAFPKGAHLHCHFNSCLPPEFLIAHARNVPNMWMKSSQSLATKEGRENAELQFQVQIDPHLQSPALPEGNLLAPDYPTWAWMRYSDFRAAFGGDDVTEAWLSSKMLLNEPEVYGLKQSVTK
jgi:adenosine deaminase CECR1